MMPREQQAVGSPIDFYSHTGHHRSESLTEVYSVPGTPTPLEITKSEFSGLDPGISISLASSSSDSGV